MTSGSPKMNKIERAHQMYREGNYTEALGYYTDALSMAKTKPQKIALHSNRAACYLKLHDFKKAAEECTSVLDLDQNHTGALMLRAQTLVTLTEHHSALFDVNRLIELNPSSEVYRNLQARLKTQLSLAPIPEDEAELEEDDHHSDEAELEEKEDKREGNKEVEEFKKHGKDMIDAAAENKKRNEINYPIPTSDIGASKNHNIQKKYDKQSAGWQRIPKPKGHSNLDYSRWDRVEDDSSEEEEDKDEDEGSQPQYRFRVKTVGVKAVR